MEVAADHLVFLRNANRFLNAFQHIHFKTCNDFLVADHTNDDTVFTLGEMRAESGLLNLCGNLVNIRLCGSWVHNDDHSFTSIIP